MKRKLVQKRKPAKRTAPLLDDVIREFVRTQDKFMADTGSELRITISVQPGYEKLKRMGEAE